MVRHDVESQQLQPPRLANSGEKDYRPQPPVRGRVLNSVEYLPVCIFQRNQNTAHRNQNLVCIPEKVVYIPFDQLNQNGCSHRTTL